MTVISDLNKARDLNIRKAKEIQVRVEKLFYELSVANAQGNTALAKKIQAEIDVNGHMIKTLTEEMKKITNQLQSETKVFTERIDERTAKIKSLKTLTTIVAVIGIVSFFAMFGGFEYGIVVFFGAILFCAPIAFYIVKLGLDSVDDFNRASGKDESLVSALRNKLKAEISLSSSVSDMESSANKLKNATSYEDKVKYEAEYRKAQASLERSKLNLNDASQMVEANQPTPSHLDDIGFIPQIYSSSAKIEKDSFPDKDLSNDAYKIYLVKKYEIEKNDVLSKFICNDKLFATVDEALEFAHSLEILQGGETAVSSTDDAQGAHETPGSSSSIELNNEEERIRNNLTPDQWEEAKAASKTSGLTLSEWRLATDKLMSELGIGYKNSKYYLGNYQYDYLNDAINFAKKNKTVNLTTASDESSTKPARNNKAIIAIFLGVLVVAAIVIFNKLENNKTAATGKVQSNSKLENNKTAATGKVQSNNKSSVESSNLKELTELNQRLEVMAQHSDSITKDLESMGNRYDQWIQANASSYLTKTPLLAENISSSQLSDNSIATPQQRNEIQNIITYRKNDITITYELLKRYQPLPPTIVANFKIIQKLRERIIADLQLLANGSITFGRFNELRLQYYKNSNLAFSKIQKVSSNTVEQNKYNTDLVKSKSITSSEFIKRYSQNMKADEKTLEDIVRNFHLD